MSDDYAQPTIHGTALLIGTCGVLILGASGSGKSTLALDLIDRAAAHGRFARLVGDDRIALTHRGGRIVAEAPPTLRGLIELRGRGLMRVPFEPAAVIRFVIDLVEVLPTRLPFETDLSMELEGVAVARLPIRQHDARAALLALNAIFGDFEAYA